MPREVSGKIIRGSGNVFADMGLPDAAELDTKARLGGAIHHIVERQRLSQAEIAAALGVNQPKVSALLNYKLEGFSVERLMHFLVALGPVSYTHLDVYKRQLASSFRFSIREKDSGVPSSSRERM